MEREKVFSDYDIEAEQGMDIRCDINKICFDRRLKYPYSFPTPDHTRGYLPKNHYGRGSQRNSSDNNEKSSGPNNKYCHGNCYA